MDRPAACCGRPADGLPRDVRAVVFDLDGTLIDTEQLYEAAFWRALDEVGWAMPAGGYAALVGLASTERRRVLPAVMGAGFPDEAFFAVYYRHRDRLTGPGIACKPGVGAMLDRLDDLGLPRAVATSASAATAARHLRLCGLAGRFDAVVTRDHVARGKPAPDCFAHAARLLGVAAADCLAIEDSAPGAQAAADAGLMVAMVPDLVPPSPETVLRCAAVLETMADVAALLPSWTVQPAWRRGRSPVRV